MMNLAITIEGRTESDLEFALQEVTRLVGEGYTSGGNSNDTGSYSFNVSGEEEPPAEDEA